MSARNCLIFNVTQGTVEKVRARNHADNSHMRDFLYD